MTSQYPVFQEGQTLTAPDLDLVLDRSSAMTHDLGLAVGFGVSRGFDGTVVGPVVRFTPGAAIDQNGAAMVVTEYSEVALPPVATSGAPAFDFVRAADGGFTVVLTAVDTAIPHSEDCAETGCGQHAELHEVRPTLMVVPGRIPGPEGSAALDPIFAVVPLTVSDTSSVSGSSIDLAAAVDKVIAGRIDDARRARLTLEMTIRVTDLPGIKAYKASTLNDVLYAAVDLVRVDRFLAHMVDLAGVEHPGVALGWLEQVGAAWQWRNAWRHSWLPPIGVVSALFGDGGTDLQEPFLEQLRALIDNFSPPVAPPAAPPKDPGRGLVFKCPDGLCIKVVPKEVHPYPDKYRWETKLPHVEKIEVIDPLHDPVPFRTSDTIIQTYQTVGTKATLAKGVILEELDAVGLTGQVDVLTQAQASQIPGFEAALTTDAADRTILVTDGADKVIATGRVPAAAVMSTLSTTAGLVTDLAATTTTLRADVDSTVAWKAETTAWKDTVQTSVAALDARVVDFERSDIGVIATTMRAELKELGQRAAKLEGSYGEVHSQVLKTVDRMDGFADRIRGATVGGTIGRSSVAVDTERDAAPHVDTLGLLDTLDAIVELLGGAGVDERTRAAVTRRISTLRDGIG
jgi:hypothetical protein